MFIRVIILFESDENYPYTHYIVVQRWCRGN